MLPYLLALVVGLVSLGLYLAAFFVPSIHRKGDFVWSGVGLFYALVLWACAGRITGGVLLGQLASVALLGWLGWQTWQFRWEGVSSEQKTVVPDNETVKDSLSGFPGKLAGWSNQALAGLKQRVSPTTAKTAESVAQTEGDANAPAVGAETTETATPETIETETIGEVQNSITTGEQLEGVGGETALDEIAEVGTTELANEVGDNEGEAALADAEGSEAESPAATPSQSQQSNWLQSLQNLELLEQLPTVLEKATEQFGNIKTGAQSLVASLSNRFGGSKSKTSEIAEPVTDPDLEAIADSEDEESEGADEDAIAAAMPEASDAPEASASESEAVATDAIEPDAAAFEETADEGGIDDSTADERAAETDGEDIPVAEELTADAAVNPEAEITSDAAADESMDDLSSEETTEAETAIAPEAPISEATIDDEPELETPEPEESASEEPASETIDMATESDGDLDSEIAEVNGEESEQDAANEANAAPSDEELAADAATDPETNGETEETNWAD